MKPIYAIRVDRKYKWIPKWLFPRKIGVHVKYRKSERFYKAPIEKVIFLEKRTTLIELASLWSVLFFVLVRVRY